MLETGGLGHKPEEPALLRPERGQVHQPGETNSARDTTTHCSLNNVGRDKRQR